MSRELNSEIYPGEPAVYEIRIKGHLGSQWTDWFGGATITLEDNGDTILTGPVVDQAALHGLLKKVRDLGTPLISINRIGNHIGPMREEAHESSCLDEVRVARCPSGQ